MPVLWDTVYPAVRTSSATYIGYIFSESLIGVMYGMLARLYTLGLQFAATVIGMMVGYSQPSAVSISSRTRPKPVFPVSSLSPA
jgi:flagellar biosynthetic protein FliR